MSLPILFYFLCTQHVSDVNISFIRSLRLCCWITTLVVLFLFRCVLEIWCGWVWVVSVLQAEASACNTDAKNNVMAGPTLLYGSDLWVLNGKGYSLLPAPGMSYLGSVKGFTWLGCFCSEDIRRQLSVIPVTANIGRIGEGGGNITNGWITNSEDRLWV